MKDTEHEEIAENTDLTEKSGAPLNEDARRPEENDKKNAKERLYDQINVTPRQVEIFIIIMLVIMVTAIILGLKN